MIKKFLLGLILSLSFLIPNSFLIIPVYAEGEFLTDATVEYKVGENGRTKVIHTITVENVFSTLYASSYTLNLENINPLQPKAFRNSKETALAVRQEGEKTALTVNFEEAVVGKGKAQTFVISFEEDGVASRTGEVWEVGIPKLASEAPFRKYEVVLSVPSSFGKEAYLSPKPQRQAVEGGRLIYYFTKEAIGKAGITAGFGEFQVFSFTLNYHLENPLAKSAYVEVAIPPDTAMQKVYYQLINPKPLNTSTDSDGNWLARFLLAPREKLNVETKGAVQIFAAPRSFPKPTQESLAANLQESEFWQTEDQQIIELAKSLQTPKAIYDFVSTTLVYDYNRVKPNVARLGAKGALASPKNAICMEFTDLFIALTRAAGIPAREVNGYAYTENPKVQPLSLVADVLHSWPEYWDREKLTWVPVDPTWGSTTGGVDFFTKLDLRHFTFVIHGKDAKTPYPPGSYKLGPNPQKDVFVSFGQLPAERTGRLEIVADQKDSFPFLKRRVSVRVKNQGGIALYNLKPKVFFGEKETARYSLDVLPPYGFYEFTVLIPFSFLGRENPESILITANNERVVISGFKNQVLIESLAILFSILSIVIVVILIRLGKIRPSMLTKWKKEYS